MFDLPPLRYLIHDDGRTVMGCNYKKIRHILCTLTRLVPVKKTTDRGYNNMYHTSNNWVGFYKEKQWHDCYYIIYIAFTQVNNTDYYLLLLFVLLFSHVCSS